MRSASKIIGDAMMLAWMIVLGPIGIVVMLVMTHARQTGNARLGAICGVFLSMPLVLTIVYGSVVLATTRRESREEKVLSAQEPA